MKGHVLHCTRVHAYLKFRVDYLFEMHFFLNSYLCLSRLNEIDGGCMRKDDDDLQINEAVMVQSLDPCLLDI